MALVRNCLARRLPLRWSLALNGVICRLNLLAHPRRRRALRSVLQSALPAGTGKRELDRQLALARAVRRLGGHTYAPVARRSREWIMRNLRPEGLEHLEALRADGTGVIVLGTHVGQNAWVAPLLRALGYPMRLTQRTRISARILLLMRRDGSLSEVLPYPRAGESGTHLKSLYDLLRGGAWIQHVGDFTGGPHPVSGNLLGQRVQCVAAPWVLARLTGAPLVPALVLADRRLNSRLLIGEPIRVGPAESLREGLEMPFQAYLDFASRHVAPMPWNLGLKNWQTLTAGRTGAPAPG